MADEAPFLVTFIFDAEIQIKKELNLYYGISKTIRKRLRYRDHRAKYIFYKYALTQDSDNAFRIYVTYEMEKEDSNLFIFKAKEHSSFIFKSKENSYIKINNLKLMNELLDISYHPGYWNHFTQISDSPRTDSSTCSPILSRK